MEGNREIRIQRPRGPCGGDPYDAAWDDHLTTWARVRQPSGDEWRGTPLVEGQRRTIFRIRHADVADTDRVVWDGRLWDVTAVIDLDGGRRWLELHAVETPT